ncbi:MAG: hydroxyphenylacetyl-CoA thioesterase PaaI [Gammaproteobacteria bacterium]|nr:hydroxyphenylacetyl-CoA thioesterase PaaI [Gammaproteobacteria bacterium]
MTTGSGANAPESPSTLETVGPLQGARRAGAAMDANDAAARFMGMELEENRPGFAQLSLTVTGEMINGVDVCHGGFIFALADTAMAHASNSRNQVSVAASAGIEFLRPTVAGDRLTARAEEGALVGRNGIYDVSVVNQNGDLIALFRGKTRTIKGAIVPDMRISEQG